MQIFIAETIYLKLRRKSKKKHIRVNFIIPICRRCIRRRRAKRSFARIVIYCRRAGVPFRRRYKLRFVVNFSLMFENLSKNNQEREN